MIRKIIIWIWRFTITQKSFSAVSITFKLLFRFAKKKKKKQKEKEGEFKSWNKEVHDSESGYLRAVPSTLELRSRTGRWAHHESRVTTGT